MVKIQYDEKKKKWMELEKRAKEGHYIDGFLKANMEAMVRNVTKQNYDGFVLVTGREGFGKSTLAMQLALFCDPKFNIDKVVFTAEQFLEAVETGDRYSVIVFDETMGYLSSRNGMSKFNKVLIKVMSEMRSKNLFVFLCIPNFFMMDWYVACHRTTGLLYIKKRGEFASYDYPTKKKLYMLGKKAHSYAVPPNFFGMFTSYFPVDKDEYEKKKQLAINEWSSDVRLDSKLITQRNDMIINSEKSNEEIAEILGVTIRQVSRIKKDNPLATL